MPTSSHASGGLLRHHADFRRLWTADAISQLGTSLSTLALPLLAIDALRATTFEVALLNVASSLPVLLIGLPAGAWCDRLRSRPVLVTADLGRALLLGTVPLAYALGHLTISLLLLVTFACGACGVFFNVARQTVLPSLVGPSGLVDGNGLLQTNRSVTYTLARAGGGYLVQLLGSTLMIVVDAVSYLWSAAWLSRISANETRENDGPRTRLWQQFGAGLRCVGSHRTLRVLAIYDTLAVLFSATNNGVFVVYLYRTVGLSAGVIGVIGVIGGIGGAGAILGAVMTGRLARAWGSARSLVIVSLVYGVASLATPLAARGARLLLFTVANVAVCFSIIALTVLVMSGCQLLCPPALLGRVNATLNFATSGASPLGALLGGLLGTFVGIRFAMWVGSVGTLCTGIWLACGHMRGRRDIAPTDDAEAPQRERHGATTSGRRAEVTDDQVSPRS